MVTVETLSDRHCEPKSWGWEEWIVNNDLYCGKRLHFNVLYGCTSLHFHAVKHETMYVESGRFHIHVTDTLTGDVSVMELDPGSSLVIPPNTPHRIIATKSPSVLVEFSTHHENSDSYRISK